MFAKALYMLTHPHTRNTHLHSDEIWPFCQVQMLGQTKVRPVLGVGVGHVGISEVADVAAAYTRAHSPRIAVDPALPVIETIPVC